VVVRDLDFVGIASLPPKADSILVVDLDAVLPTSVAVKLLKVIPWRDSKFQQVLNVIDLIEFPSGNAPDVAGTGSPGSG
jgi:hypothetical protein